MGRANKSPHYYSRTFSLPFRSKNGETPYRVNIDGSISEGKYGPRLPRSKGDYLALNQSIGKYRQVVSGRNRYIRDEVQNISDRYANLYGGSAMARRDLNNFLDREFAANNERIQDLQSQFELYGKDSVQGRVLDRMIAQEVQTRRILEDFAGYRDHETTFIRADRSPNFSSKSDPYGYVPADPYSSVDGTFGKRSPRGFENAEYKAKIQQIRDVNRSMRQSIYDSRDFSQSSRIESLNDNYIIQRDLYKGTSQEAIITQEIYKNTRLLKNMESWSEGSYKMPDKYYLAIPPYLRGKL